MTLKERGRVLSAANETGLKTAIGGLHGAMEAIKSVLAQVLGQEEEPEEDAKAKDDKKDDKKEVASATESAIDGDVINLTERAIRADGTTPVKLISPGWGSSGYYPAHVLERDGPAIFRSGLKMYWNHPTPTEEAMRPEGDLNQLAAELISAARWEPNGQAGAGLYADAKVFEPYRGPVNELAPHIGVSIRATGKTTTGQAEGRKGPIIEAITGAKSVDFVTIPGAGGQILQLFESARNGQFSPHKEESMNEAQQKQLQEALDGVKALTAANVVLQRQLAQNQAERQITQAMTDSTLPAPAHRRVLAEALRHAPISETGVLDITKMATVITEAITAEETYLQSLSESGRIVGMGSSTGSFASGNGDATKDAATLDAAEKRMKEAFAGLGLVDKELGHAIAGHGH